MLKSFLFEKGWPFQWYLWHYCFKADRQIWCEVNVLTLTFVLIWTADRIHLYIFFLYVKKDKVYKAMEFKSWMQCRENETQREERKCLRCGHKVIWLLSGHVFYSFFFFFSWEHFTEFLLELESPVSVNWLSLLIAVIYFLIIFEGCQLWFLGDDVAF